MQWVLYVLGIVAVLVLIVGFAVGWFDPALAWIDRHAAVFLILGLLGLGYLGAHVFREESHTREVQVKGGPVAKCLLEALKEVAPLLERVPSVQKPLEEYVKLQTPRYPGVKCPDGEK